MKQFCIGNTYSQISIQGVFAVKRRENLILKPWRDQLHKYIYGLIEGEGAKPLAVNGWMDHVHVFFGLPVKLSISSVMDAIKSRSSGWINDNGFLPCKFNWQSGFGAFSYSKDQRDTVIKYIINQEKHHGEITFRQEYLKLLKDFDVEYNEKYLFDFFD